MANPVDELLRQYVACTDASSAEVLLEELMVQHAQPGVQKVVRYRLAFQGNLEAQDIEDVTGDVVVELIARLRAIRGGKGNDSIGSFAGYAAVAAYHACNEYLRRKYPNRHRLKTRLRYLLNQDKRFDIWESAPSEWLCGFSRWRGEGQPAASGEALSRWRDRLSDLPHGQHAIHPASLLERIFQRMDGPFEFDVLVDMVGHLWGVDDQPQGTELTEADLVSGASRADRRLELQQWVAALWKQICELPRAQRVALLLNLRTSGGGSAAALFPVTGAAGIHEMARALEFTPEELAAVWNLLPLEDLAIAEMLHVTRQQVINLRKSARERLLRRIGGKDRLWLG